MADKFFGSATSPDTVNNGRVILYGAVVKEVTPPAGGATVNKDPFLLVVQGIIAVDTNTGGFGGGADTVQNFNPVDFIPIAFASPPDSDYCGTGGTNVVTFSMAGSYKIGIQYKVDNSEESVDFLKSTIGYGTELAGTVQFGEGGPGYPPFYEVERFFNRRVHVVYNNNVTSTERWINRLGNKYQQLDEYDEYICTANVGDTVEFGFFLKGDDAHLYEPLRLTAIISVQPVVLKNTLVLDTFTEGSTVALSSHTGEVGATWAVSNAFGGAAATLADYEVLSTGVFNAKGANLAGVYPSGSIGMSDTFEFELRFNPFTDGATWRTGFLADPTTGAGYVLEYVTTNLEPGYCSAVINLYSRSENAVEDLLGTYDLTNTGGLYFTDGYEVVITVFSKGADKKIALIGGSQSLVYYSQLLLSVTDNTYTSGVIWIGNVDSADSQTFNSVMVTTPT